ncbi:MAG TPA: hypothetical protein VFQ74_02090 [Pseudolysinimonas sp.]|nr:hypothetical protein [Pseudolysinimonas sp.]
MIRSSARRRGERRRALAALAAVIALAAGAVGLALGSAEAASASLGSVPPEVTAYVTSGAMVARLNDVYGPNASGTAGITFDDTTKAGPISRVYEWTADRLANRPTDHPVQLTNNWVVPITIGGKSVGLATIWINPQTVEAELAEFSPSAELGTALTAVPATAALVRDPATGAWLALADGKVTPLVAGRSGLTGPVPVGSLKLSPASPAPIATTEPNTGLALAIGIVGLIVIIIVVALLLPRRRATKKVQPDAAPAEEPAPVAPVEPAPVEPPAAQAATTKPATPKPAGPRPSGRTPTTANAAKPAPSKPPVSRSASSKPPASKPPAPKQPPRPRTPKPPADPGSDAS